LEGDDIMNITKHAAFVTLCAAAATLAIADEAPSVTLQLRGPVDAAHAEQVYQEIRSAARQVCEPLESKELSREHSHEQCVDQAVAKAVAQVQSSALTNVHLSRVGDEQSSR
jgi:UrcA family protein